MTTRALFLVAVVCLALACRGALANNDEPEDLGAKVQQESRRQVEIDEEINRREEKKAQEALGVAGMPDEPEADEDTVSEPSYDAKMASRVKVGFSSWDKDSDGKLSREELKNRLEEVSLKRRAAEEAQIKETASEAWGNLTKVMKMDTDGDGMLSMAELSKAREELSKKTQAAHEATQKGDNIDEADNIAMFTFLHLDWGRENDGPKRLPMKQMFEIAFNIADQNQDGKIDSDEMPVLYDPFHFKRAEAVKAMAQAQLKLADADSDGKISFQEYQTTMPPPPPPPSEEEAAEDTSEPETETHEESLKSNFEKYDKSTFDKDGIPQSDGKLDLDEFTLMEYPMHTHDMDLDSIFEHDKDNDKKMTLDELLEGVVHFGHALHHEEL